VDHIKTCPACGYDTSATNSALCSECGCDIENEFLRREGAKDVWGIVVCFGTASLLWCLSVLIFGMPQAWTSLPEFIRIVACALAVSCGLAAALCFLQRGRLRYAAPRVHAILSSLAFTYLGLWAAGVVLLKSF